MSDRSIETKNEIEKSIFHRYIYDLIRTSNLDHVIKDRSIDIDFVINEFIECCKRATEKDLRQVKTEEELDEDDDVINFKKYLIETLTEIQDWSVHPIYTWTINYFNLPLGWF